MGSLNLGNEFEDSLVQISNMVNIKVLQNILKPKDERFKTVDEVISYAVDNFSKLDEMFEFISEKLGIYMEFDKETLVEMINSTYDDVRTKMMKIKLFETVPYWWIVFPDEDRLKDFLRNMVYNIASDMAKEMAIEDETSKSELDFTLPQVISSIRSGMAIPSTDNPQELLSLLEKALYGDYMGELSDVINTHLDGSSPVENWNETVLKDVAETVMTSPELNDNLVRVSEMLKKVKKSVENASSPTLRQLNKLMEDAINRIDNHFEMMKELRSKEPTADDGFKIYNNLTDLNNNLNAINEMLSKLKEVTPNIEKNIKQQFAPAFNEFMREVSSQLQQFQNQVDQGNLQQVQNIALQMMSLNPASQPQMMGQPSSQSQSLDLSEKEYLTEMINSIENVVKSLKTLSEAKRKVLESKLLIVIDNLLNNDLPKSVADRLNQLKKEVVQ